MSRMQFKVDRWSRQASERRLMGFKRTKRVTKALLSRDEAAPAAIRAWPKGSSLSQDERSKKENPEGLAPDLSDDADG